MRVFTNALRRRAKHEISKTCTTATAIQTSKMSVAILSADKRRKSDEDDDEPMAKRLSVPLIPNCYLLWCTALDLNAKRLLVEPVDRTVMLNPNLFCGLQNSLLCDLKTLYDNYFLNVQATTMFLLSMIFRRLVNLFSNAKDEPFKENDAYDYAGVYRASAKLLLSKDLSLQVQKVPDLTGKAVDRYCRKQPNYFVAVQVNNPEIIKNLQNVQNAIIESNWRAESALISLATTHITLMVMHLDEEHCLHDAKKGLRLAAEKLRHLHFQPLTLTFDGVSSFKNEVVFAKVKNDTESSRLTQLADIVNQSFAEYDIISTDSKPFSPHLTIAKLSKDVSLKRKGVKKLPTEYYENYVDAQLGKEEIKSIQLLSMLKKKDRTGYYYCVEELPFTG